ncbi:hypothetical protein [Nesterenkonia sphaerica]|uniref:Uncharacterized protein n=1 Tax=Nesterenkonia sphaerica TaxID=1804988 RepID=A0A5R9ABX5_9MICC|nr:hypothetical protein [Nesterenkonia sphaerica]TLP75515.1 hypothetical protein FEF27_07615 [Nesterenkonia sphaerica]
MSFDIKDLHPAARDDVLDALNAIYAAMDRHGIERVPVIPGEILSDHLDRIVEEFRRKLAATELD